MPTGRLRARRRDGYRPLYSTGGYGGGGMDGLGLSFDLPLDDLGSGQVNINPAYVKGSSDSTFTRASVAWTKLSTGLWTQVNSGVARSRYLGANTAVGVYGGYFTEGAATQLVTPTAAIRDMTDASWAVVTMTKAKNATGIDGVANSASSLTATGANSTALQTLVAAASSRTFSAFVRRKTGTGTVLIKQGATTLDITALINSTTYTLVQLNASVLNVAFGFQINTSGDAIEVDFNQFEAGGFATSPMASAGAARNADSLIYPFSGNISGTVGSIYLEATSNNIQGGQDTLIAVSDIATRTPIYFSTLNNLGLYDGNSERQLTALPTRPFSVVTKCATVWSGVVCNGIVSGTVTSGTFDGDLDISQNIYVGKDSGASNPTYGTIKNLRIYNSALNTAQLQAMTT